MELASNIKDEFLVCKICFTRFSRKKLPKMLHCGHTFCEHCLVSAANCKPHGGYRGSSSENQEPKSIISCPLCRKITELTDDGVQGLSNDFTLLGLMDMISPLQRQESQEEEDEQYLGAAASAIDKHRSSSERCIQCHKRFSESISHCGHTVCDICLQWYLETCKDNDNACPVCRDNDVTMEKRAAQSMSTGGGGGDRAPQRRSGDRILTQVPFERNRNAMEENKPPVPVPRNMFKSNKPHDTDVCSPKIKEVESDGPLLVSKGSDRPPPYNPTFASTISSSSREGSQTPPLTDAPKQIARKRTVSPPPRVTSTYSTSVGPAMTAEGTASASSPSGSSQDLDTVSLCSVKSDQSPAVYKAPPDNSTLRRTQSMRRPPPPPRRRYGTLPSPINVQPSPPGTSNFAHSSEDLSRRPQLLNRCQTLSPEEGRSYFDSPTAPLGTSPPVPPARRIFNSKKPQFKCVKKFGNYSDRSMQTSCFKLPSKVRLSERGDIVVADTDSMTVQVFNKAGDYKSMFKVLGARDASFMSNDKLCIATHRGIQIYATNGTLVDELPVGSTVATTPYKFGFVAATSKSLLIYHQTLTLVKEVTRYKMFTPSKKWSPIQKKKTQVEFQNIRDVIVTNAKLLAIFDTGANSIIVMDDEGLSVSVIDLANPSCGVLKRAESIAVDRFGNFFVSDTGNHRVLKVTSAGTTVKSMMSYRSKDESVKRFFPHGLAVTETDLLIVTLSGDRSAEIRIYATT